MSARPAGKTRHLLGSRPSAKARRMWVSTRRKPISGVAFTDSFRRMASNAARSPLLGLPAELRARIFTLALGSNLIHLKRDGLDVRSSPWHPCPLILTVTAQMRDIDAGHPIPKPLDLFLDHHMCKRCRGGVPLSLLFDCR